MHFDEFYLRSATGTVGKVYLQLEDTRAVLDRYYAVWQWVLRPILRTQTPNLQLIQVVSGRPLSWSLRLHAVLTRLRSRKEVQPEDVLKLVSVSTAVTY
jgi:hypothetical protein